MFKGFKDRVGEELPRFGISRNLETLENREACRERVKRLRKLDPLVVDSPLKLYNPSVDPSEGMHASSRIHFEEERPWQN